LESDFNETRSEYVGRVCPITRRELQPGDKIVVCSVCDTAYTAEGWSYIDGECPICGLEEATPAVVGAPSPPPTEVVALTAPPGAWLYLIEGYEGKQRYPLNDSGDTRIGRDLDNDIVLDSNFVSGRHALIRSDQGAFTLYDLASRNGTWLNGHRVHRSILYDGDVLTFGDRISLIFKQVSS